MKGPLAPETPAVAPSTPGAAGPATDPSTVDGLVNSLPEAEQETDLNAPVQLQVYLPDGQAVRCYAQTGSALLAYACSTAYSGDNCMSSLTKYASASSVKHKWEQQEE